MNTLDYSMALFFLAYMIVCSGSYIILNIIAFDSLRYYLRKRRTHQEDLLVTGLEPPISVIVPAYNESYTIVSSLQSILKLNYPNLEVIVVNDGSTDDTLRVLKTAFDFEEFPEALNLRLPCKSIKHVYSSRRIDNLRMVDKENGGKADATNAGINLSRSPLFCCIDADSLLEPASLIRVVQPFLNNPETVATGGTVRIANGCTIKQGHIIRKGVPSNLLALFQVVEYLRAFLFGRIGWSRIKGLMLISGAFGLFRKEQVIQSGGYTTETIGEDMDLVLRMYRNLIKKGLSHRVEFIADPVCWTEAPEKLGEFASQRKRWHRGLSESLYLNRELLFSRKSGTVGWVSFPFFIIFEWLSPFVELAGYLFTVYLLAMDKLELVQIVPIFILAILLSVFLSVIAFLLDEITFPGMTKIRSILLLVLISILECFGYRQLNMIYKIWGAISWIAKTDSEWGEMTRKHSRQYDHFNNIGPRLRQTDIHG